ncbi:MAG: acyl-CoA thioesterase, partial [Ignavibacteriaceae bacterium]|nr:acyl-CoA thioesterase [Ignavibacteriaceae bacterium]
YEALISDFNLIEDYWSNDDYVVPIIKSKAAYHNPIKYGDEITVDLIVEQLKSSSFELNYICKNGEGKICNKVSTVHVVVDKKTWKKTKMTDEIHEGLAKHLRQFTV